MLLPQPLRPLMSKRCALFFFALWAMACEPSQAQEFTGRAQVGPVTQTGFYRVPLPPQVVGHLQPQAQDLRLFRPDGQEVPYILQTDRPVTYSRITVKDFTRLDSAKQTILRLNFGQPVYPHQVKFFVSGPTFYHRSANIFLGQKVETRKRRRKHRRRAARQEKSVQTVLQSASENLVELPRHKVDQLRIEIDNADSPPLNIDSVHVLQQTQYLVANLEVGQLYSLAFGDAKAPAPQYDLAYFKDSLPKNLPEAPLHPIKTSVVPEVKGTALSLQFMWAALVAVALGLAFMTRQLLRDMEKNKE